MRAIVVNLWDRVERIGSVPDDDAIAEAIAAIARAFDGEPPPKALAFAQPPSDEELEAVVDALDKGPTREALEAVLRVIARGPSPEELEAVLAAVSEAFVPKAGGVRPTVRVLEVLRRPGRSGGPGSVPPKSRSRTTR